MRLPVYLLVATALVLAGCFGQDADDYEEPEVENDRSGGRHSSYDDNAEPSSEEILEMIVEKSYFGGTPVGAIPLNTGCTQVWYNPGGPENLGGVCFSIPRWTHLINFSVEDDAGFPIGVFWRTLDDGGFTIDSGSACAQKNEIEPDEDAKDILISIDDAAFSTGICEQASVPTEGRVEATILHQE